MKLKQYLQQRFGYSDFRPGQREIIEFILERNNVLGVLATGSGKTLCYQFVSEWLDGITLVLSPLISLMEDQWTRLRQNGYKKVGMLHSGLEKSRYENEWQEIIRNNRKIIFISPERLNDNQFLRKMSQHKISLIVVDEAHCVSQWGYDFRPDYQLIYKTYSVFGNPPVMALTGTASPKVQEDILDKLQIKDAKKVILSMNRPNIAFYKHNVSNDEEKKSFLTKHLKNLIGSGIIYTSTRKQTEQLAEWLSKQMNTMIPAYHAGLSNEDRTIIQTQFIKGQSKILVATNAFGMGIDKDDIRFVIHYQLPTSIENYLQEIGRIGRDGKDGVAIILYNSHDLDHAKSIIDFSIPNRSQIKEIINLIVEDKGIRSYNAELNDYLPIKSIFYQLIQGGWITQELLTDHYFPLKNLTDSDLDLLAFEWERLRIEKQRNAIKLNEVMTSDTCIRKELLLTISEFDHHFHSFCCSNCKINLTHYYENSDTHKEMITQYNFDWIEELKRLLPVHTFK